jgi:hypothetical protein
MWRNANDGALRDRAARPAGARNSRMARNTATSITHLEAPGLR